MRLLLVGHGRMGKLVESLATEYDASIAGVITTANAETALRDGDFGPVDAAIDFTLPDAVPRNLSLLAARGVSVVIGTTGWSAHERDLRSLVSQTGIGVLVAPNFSLGINLFQLVIEDAARRFAPHESFGAWIHELHHAAKKDAPSGTALQLKSGMEHAGYRRPINVASTRAGSIPGTHSVGFDGPADSITLTHTVRDRAVFARGALEAARWLKGKRGWFTMRDLLNDEAHGPRSTAHGPER
jgi:4-hydroxy-tetrahydrodipicolinate reductase